MQFNLHNFMTEYYTEDAPSEDGTHLLQRLVFSATADNYRVVAPVFLDDNAGSSTSMIVTKSAEETDDDDYDDDQDAADGDRLQIDKDEGSSDDVLDE